MCSIPEEGASDLRLDKITLVDVAREAGVSAATVSRLMRGGARVNAETRERIVAAAHRLEFDLEARKTSRVIAFLLSNRGVLQRNRPLGGRASDSNDSSPSSMKVEFYIRRPASSNGE